MLMVLALLAGFVVVAVGRPGLFVLYHWGFGRGWTCSYAGPGEPVCIKSPAQGAAD
jgi:hypothetical protein